ncbi:hypothetical protein Bbelb_256320 [Branchiostoma belcheri]|nr:hypothetical protein Bbelb_256320 [Branchiostoma belcheri]
MFPSSLKFILTPLPTRHYRSLTQSRPIYLTLSFPAIVHELQPKKHNNSSKRTLPFGKGHFLDETTRLNGALEGRRTDDFWRFPRARIADGFGVISLLVRAGRLAAPRLGSPNPGPGELVRGARSQADFRPASWRERFSDGPNKNVRPHRSTTDPVTAWLRGEGRDSYKWRKPRCAFQRGSPVWTPPLHCVSEKNEYTCQCSPLGGGGVEDRRSLTNQAPGRWCQARVSDVS